MCLGKRVGWDGVRGVRGCYSCEKREMIKGRIPTLSQKKKCRLK